MCNVGRRELQKEEPVLRQNARKMGKFLLLCLGKRDGGTPSYGEDGENGPFFLEDFYKGASVLLSRFFRVGIIPVL